MSPEVATGGRTWSSSAAASPASAASSGSPTTTTSRVTLIDRNNYHQFQPLLYQVATSQLAPSDIAFSLRKLFRDDADVDVKLGEVDLDRPGDAHRDDRRRRALRRATRSCWPPARSRTSSARRARTSTRSRSTRSTTRTRLRSRILAVFEDADRDPSLIDDGRAQLRDRRRRPDRGRDGRRARGPDPRHDERRVPRPRGLGGADPPRRPGPHAARRRSPTRRTTTPRRCSARKGVRLHLGVAVTEVGAGHVTLADGTTIRTRCVVWGGGIKAPRSRRRPGSRRGRGGRIDVAPDLTVDGRRGVYAIGDVANIPSPDGAHAPQLGSVALQSGAGRPRTSSPTSPASRASRSTTTTRASWR